MTGPMNYVHIEDLKAFNFVQLSRVTTAVKSNCIDISFLVQLGLLKTLECIYKKYNIQDSFRENDKVLDLFPSVAAQSNLY